MASCVSPNYIRTMQTIWSSTKYSLCLISWFPKSAKLNYFNMLYSLTYHCIYQVTPGLPAPPEDCRVTRETNDSMTVVCQPAWSGGLIQTFHLELWDGKEKELLRNITEKRMTSLELNRLQLGKWFIWKQERWNKQPACLMNILLNVLKVWSILSLSELWPEVCPLCYFSSSTSVWMNWWKR